MGKYHSFGRWLLVLLAALLNAQACLADVYMHNPRGSNNRLNEKSANRNNGNRLFDSQNNNRGGYNAGDVGTGQIDANDDEDEAIGRLEYFEGSKLPVEWTNQHGCGDTNEKTGCHIVIQYYCNEELRDGVTTNTPNENNDNTNTGLHENQEYYEDCKDIPRNQGLFTADQNLKGDSAIYTRQNPQGTRRGLECPEERDYYPWWHFSPWNDVAVLTNEPERCPYYRQESQNVKGREKTVAGQQVTLGGKLPPPDCFEANFTRDNHLGDIPEGYNHRYNWTLPSVTQACRDESAQQCQCVMRLRYNITTEEVHWDLNSTWNDIDLRDGGVIENNPLVDVGANQGLRLAVNTAQHGRTFQDRSHIFIVKRRGGTVGLGGAPPGAVVHNINVRGKRGNIVQTYPAVEYDFTPNVVRVKAGEFVHFQWTGSNTHDNGNPGGDGQTGDDGEGTGGTDRSNVVQIASLDDNYPLHAANITMFPQIVAVQLATLGTSDVDPLLNNAPATFDAGPMQMNVPGTYHYMCTRNNNFSNRSQKGTIIVEP